MPKRSRYLTPAEQSRLADLETAAEAFTAAGQYEAAFDALAEAAAVCYDAGQAESAALWMDMAAGVRAKARAAGAMLTRQGPPLDMGKTLENMARR